MNTPFSIWITLIVCCGLSLWGCGDEGGSGGGSGGSAGTGSSGTSGGGASCASVCGVLSACPAALVDAASCPTICEQTMSASCRDCIADSNSCGAECMAACSAPGGGGMNNGGGGAGMNNGGGGAGMNNGGGNQSGGGIGQGCTFNSDCASEICIGGGLQDGYCSQTCTDFTDCPEFWDCDNNPGGAGQACLNNG